MAIGPLPLRGVVQLLPSRDPGLDQHRETVLEHTADLLRGGPVEGIMVPHGLQKLPDLHREGCRKGWPTPIEHETWNVPWSEARMKLLPGGVFEVWGRDGRLRSSWVKM